MSRADEDLVRRARGALGGGHAPYSGIAVAAALRTVDGRIFTGANVENASFGLTVCAERVAVWKAVTEGAQDFDAIAVVSDADVPFPPCGACLQVLREFARDLTVLIGGTAGPWRRTSLQALLPGAFGPENLTGKDGAP